MENKDGEGEQMKEYYCMSICSKAQDTEDKINKFANEGWKLVCSYAQGGNWLILERDKKVCKVCGK